MCGIFGYVLYDTPPERRPSLNRAVEDLRHRGPDGEGVFLDDSAEPVCGLAHTRLAIIDLSTGGQQPMSDGRYTITFNGEIYNYRELRNELESLGVQFRSQSDTEVLLLGYRRWGRELLPRLRGMFAFAIWDAVERALFLARDRMGVKPLYYARVNKGIVFASELRSLLNTNLIPRKLSPRGVSSYLAFGSAREPNTIINDIMIVPAGTHAILKSETLKITTYWTPPLRIDRSISRKVAIEELSELLREAVALRLISDVPVGIFLSGGLDSSAVVALAAAASRSKIHTFTVTFDEAVYNESRRAKATADRFGAQHHPIHLSATRAMEEMEDALNALDQPSADGINTYFVSKAVRRAGVSVALSGIGGDELFAGYPNFRRFRSACRMMPLLRALHVRETPRLLSSGPWSLRKSVSLLSTHGNPFAMYSVFRSMLDDGQRRRLLTLQDGFGEEGAHSPEPFDASISTWATSTGGDPVGAYGLFDLTNYLRNTLLRDTDVMGMAHALEIREPLLDHRLVERALTLPGGMKLASGRNKPLLADSVPSLAPSIVNGPKMGFTLPLDTWLRGSLRGWAEGRLRDSQYLRGREVERLWAGFDRGQVSYARVWTLLALLTWTRKHGVDVVGD